MGKKRKSDATSRLDEVDRTLYATFCNAANSVSQLYTHTMNHQKLSFLAGERHALDKLHNWIMRQQEEDGTRVTAADIFAYIQNELDYRAEELPVSPRMPFQQLQQYQTATYPGIPVSTNSSGPVSAMQGQGQGLRSSYDHQPKNSLFSNALSSPVHRSLQNYHLGHSGYYPNTIVPSGNGDRNVENGFAHQQQRDLHTNTASFDSSMDMHADSPVEESSY